MMLYFSNKRIFIDEIYESHKYMKKDKYEYLIIVETYSKCLMLTDRNFILIINQILWDKCILSK